jgi:hypothetical protein
MPKLVTAVRFESPDAAYVTLVEARRGLADEAAAALDLRLVLILANHIGDLDVLSEAIALAKAAMAGSGEAEHASLLKTRHDNETLS